MCSSQDDPTMHDTLAPVGTDNDGNGIWTDGTDRWNAGEPLTQAEAIEAAAFSRRYGGPCARCGVVRDYHRLTPKDHEWSAADGVESTPADDHR